MKKIIAAALSFALSLGASRAASLPSGLSKSDVTRTIEILGFGTTNRSLLTATPLGIEPGLRVGVIQTLIVTHDLKNLGNANGNSPNVVPIPSIHIAKGFPKDIDLEVTFMPPTVLSYVEKYGASFGWTIMNERVWPIALSIRPHFSFGRMYGNDFSNWNYGVNLALSRDFIWWEPYAHLGYAMSQGCVRSSLALNNTPNCSLEPAGVGAIGMKFNLPLTFVFQLDTHNLEPSLSMFVGKDF